MKQFILFGIGIAAGLLLAFWEAQPGFDDTGMLVVAVFAAGALLAMAAGQRPWLAALAVGLWIPLHDIALNMQFASLAALAAAFLGAYAGWGMRKIFTHTLQHG